MKEIVLKDKKRNKKTTLKALKNLGLFLLVCLVYGSSCYFNGFAHTTYRIISLIVYCIVGLVSFFAIYYIAYFISALIYKSKRKKIVNQINCDDKLNDLMVMPKYKFSYEKAKPLNENVKDLLSKGKLLTVDIASSYGNKGRYNLLNFTVYDALTITGDFIDIAQDKVERIIGFIPFVNLQDKPLGFLEKALSNALNDEVSETPTKKSGILGSIFSKFAVPMLKGQIDKEANGFISLVGSEAFKVFGKNGKKYKPIIDETKVAYD